MLLKVLPPGTAEVWGFQAEISRKPESWLREEWRKAREKTERTDESVDNLIQAASFFIFLSFCRDEFFLD